MQLRDTPATTTALRAFQLAWQKVVDDYTQREINSEHCLQAALYRHLRNILPNSFKIYAEAVVRLSKNGKADTGKSNVVMDLLVCENITIVAAIELKYTPRTEPNAEKVKKDLTSLAHISNRKKLDDRVKIEMPRFRLSDGETLELNIATQRKLIFAAFCSDEGTSLSEANFLQNFRPDTGYWKNIKKLPPNLCVALARTADTGKASPIYYGPAFERIGSNTISGGDA